MTLDNMSNIVEKHPDRGVSRLGLLFFFTIVGAVVWLGFKVIPFYHDYLDLESWMHAQADKASVFSDEQIRKVLWKQIQQLGIPVDDPSALKINRFTGKIIIDLEYEEVLYVEFDKKHSYDLYVFKFNPHVEQTVVETSRSLSSY